VLALEGVGPVPRAVVDEEVAAVQLLVVREDEALVRRLAEVRPDPAEPERTRPWSEIKAELGL